MSNHAEPMRQNEELSWLRARQATMLNRAKSGVSIHLQWDGQWDALDLYAFLDRRDRILEILKEMR